MKPRKPTFKRRPRETGLAAVGNSNPWTDIKYGGERVGVIIPRSHNRNGWTPGIMVMKTVPDDNPNCAWTWVYFKEQETEQAARDFIVNNWEKLSHKYTIRVERP